jgi:hypothetical protein
MLGNFVTLDPRPKGREALCGVCKGPIDQPSGKGRPRQTCSPKCRKALSRALKSGRSLQTPPARDPRDLLFDIYRLYLSPGSVLEVFHPEHKRGELWPEGDVLRVRFRYHTRWTTEQLRELQIVAWHETSHLPRRFERGTPPRKKKVVQLFDTDHNRDLEGDSAKWDVDTGFSKKAEVAVSNVFSVRDRGLEGERDSPRRNPTKFVADRLAFYVEEACRKSKPKPGTAGERAPQ